MAEEFKKGDIVELKTKSPQMTVTGVSTIGGGITIYTSWFSGSKLSKGSFPPDALKLVKSSEPEKND